MMEKKILRIALLAAVAIILLQTCGKTTIKDCPDPPKPEIITLVQIDTIWAEREPVRKPIKPTQVASTPITVIPEANPCDSVRTYNDSLDTPDVTIYAESSVTGELNSQILGYKLKVPRLVTKTITNTEIHEVKVPVTGLFAGANISGNKNSFIFDISGELELIHKNGYAYSYSYGILTNTHEIGLKKKLF